MSISEKEIMKNWEEKNTDNPLVSISCIAYNHEKYISDAIEGFLMQETDFPFEILIHDDASTDRTAEIIREYEKKYPNIIKPIYQTENQYSKGVKRIDYTFNHSRAKGKYYAVCEGDDYWIDLKKLQKQVDYMECHPDCTFCFHNAVLRSDIGKVLKKPMIPVSMRSRNYYHGQNRIYNAGDVQLLRPIPTASFVCQKYVLNDPPEWFLNAPAGDIAIELIASSFGYAYYMDELMSCYRVGVKSSLTYNWKREDNSKKISRIAGFIKMYNDFNIYSDHKFTEEISLAKKALEVDLELIRGTSIWSNENYKQYFYNLNIMDKIKCYIKYYSPEIFDIANKALPESIKCKFR